VGLAVGRVAAAVSHAAIPEVCFRNALAVVEHVRHEILRAGLDEGLILRTTRRQNFLVPPRVHRSFPLSEIQV